jgi:predicted acyltransferase
MNSIAIYVMDWTLEKPTHAAIERHFGGMLERAFPDYHALMIHIAVMGVFWLILYAMYRRRLFLRV